jgi:hypothetical protein
VVIAQSADYLAGATLTPIVSLEVTRSALGGRDPYGEAPKRGRASFSKGRDDSWQRASEEGRRWLGAPEAFEPVRLRM